jgi:crotonobetainyl-CoA:carnitine CoA-transferase CaiB-like acyl-CoA transferase
MRGALEGIVVLELGSYLTAPYAAMLLADLGAEVVKIEPPVSGDPFRGWGTNGYNSTFCCVNRNKKSVTLDLKTDAGRHVFLRLAGRGDVIIENGRPGVAQKLGIDYDSIRKLNPRVIYCSISGFGQDGPYCDRPGYDTIGQAMGGLLGLVTSLNDPQLAGISFSDHLTGIFACYGIQAALFARERTGQGQKVEASLLQSTVSFVQEAAARYFATSEVPRRETRVQAAQAYAFVAQDGRPLVIHLSSPPKFWESLIEAVGKPELRTDARFQDREGRRRHYETLRTILAEVFATKTRDAWLERLRQHDVPCAPLNTLEEVFADPQVQRLGMAVEMAHPTMGRVRLSGNPIQFEQTPVSYRLAPPALGEHTDEVLTTLGYDGETLQRWRQEGVI